MQWIVPVVALFALVGLAGYFIGLYNSLIVVRHNIDKAWANIDVLLKQRHDELPKLIETCKGYMKHEQGVLEGLTAARTAFMNAPTTQAKTIAENELSRGLKTLFAVAENYPDLKANQGFLALQGRISALENSIADRREFFNETANLYNIRIEQFPDSFVAGFLHYAPHPLLEIPKTDTEDVKVQF
ncbi:MAG TPA: LemA family protein [Candidatus Eisenbacteria bacterium]|nr:LemA family protein [Candidatus Eisenbacteria bacterium]